MSRFRYSGGSRALSVGALDARYEAFPQPGATRTRSATSDSRALARRCPPQQQRSRLARLTPTQREALLLGVFDRLPAHEAARSMRMTVERYEAEFAAGWRRVSADRAGRE